MTSMVPTTPIFSSAVLKKSTLVISFVFAAILGYLLYIYNCINQGKFDNPAAYVSVAYSAADQFWVAGLIICFTTWVWVNVVAVKTRKLIWLWIPFLFVMFVAISNAYQHEALFHFKKANGMWNGSFSLTYFFAAGYIFMAGFVLLINSFILRRYLKNSAR